MKAIHINIFGAPGSGKSTFRSKLFYDMKMQGYKVEEVTEYAKDLTYSNDTTKLMDSVLILGQQHHKHKVLNNQVDYILTDSPFIMGCMYIQDDCEFRQEIINLSLKMNQQYCSINIFLERQHSYKEEGRNENEAQSDKISQNIKSFLKSSSITFITLNSSTTTNINIKELLNIKHN